jgi:hypothetical protein
MSKILYNILLKINHLLLHNLSIGKKYVLKIDVIIMECLLGCGGILGGGWGGCWGVGAYGPVRRKWVGCWNVC